MCGSDGPCARLRINSLDHGKAIFAYSGQNTDGPQQSRCIIDQVEKGRHREQAEQPSHNEAPAGRRSPLFG